MSTATAQREQHRMVRSSFQQPPMATPDAAGKPWTLASVACSCGASWVSGGYGADEAAAAAEGFWDRGHASKSSLPVQSTLFATSGGHTP